MSENQITVSAPGKLMLLGEHAVVYGHPCIVTAVDQRLHLTVELIDKLIFELNAPDVNIKNYIKPIKNLLSLRHSDLERSEREESIPKGAKFVEIAAANFLDTPGVKSAGLKITTKSQFSSQYGFGSSSASTVCTIFALSKLFNIKLSQKQIFDLAYKTVLDVQGKGSGFDVAAAIWGGTIYFVTGGKTIKPLFLSFPRKRESRNWIPNQVRDDIPLIVGYSGIKADTVTIVEKVSKFAQKHPKTVSNIYNQIEFLVNLAAKEIQKANWQELGELMNINQGYLEALGVSSDKLSSMIFAARNAGASGAKLSGAGIGDCMVALSNSPKVKSAIKKAGGQIINVKTNAEGVRVEN